MTIAISVANLLTLTPRYLTTLQSPPRLDVKKPQKIWGLFSLTSKCFSVLICARVDAAAKAVIRCAFSLDAYPCPLPGCTAMKNTLCLCILALSLVHAHARDAKFIDPARLHPQDILPPPAAPGSSASADELATLHRIQSNRSPAQILKAQRDEARKNIFLYQNVIDEKFTPENFPVIAEFSRRIKKDVSIASKSAKLSFHRVRPYNIDKTLLPVCEIKTADNSYPSQYSTLAYVYAFVLIDLLPQKREAILTRADAYASERLICGAHFPSDVAAGKRYAEAIYQQMDGNPNFQRALKKARNEVRAFYHQAVLP